MSEEDEGVTVLSAAQMFELALRTAPLARAMAVALRKGESETALRLLFTLDIATPEFPVVLCGLPALLTRVFVKDAIATGQISEEEAASASIGLVVGNEGTVPSPVEWAFRLFTTAANGDIQEATSLFITTVNQQSEFESSVESITEKDSHHGADYVLLGLREYMVVLVHYAQGISEQAWTQFMRTNKSQFN
jgi:hypothetical protein